MGVFSFLKIHSCCLQRGIEENNLRNKTQGWLGEVETTAKADSHRISHIFYLFSAINQDLLLSDSNRELPISKTSRVSTREGNQMIHEEKVGGRRVR